MPGGVGVGRDQDDKVFLYDAAGNPIGSVGDRLKVDAVVGLGSSNRLIYSVVPLTNGGSNDMTVNGSVTPIVFTAGPTTTNEVWYASALLISGTDGGNVNPDRYFGIAGGLSNGTLIEQQINSVDYEMMTLKTNTDIAECFQSNGSIRGIANGYLNDANFFTGGMRLDEGSTPGVELRQADGDQFKVTIQDNLSPIDLHRLTLVYYRVVS